MPKKPIIDIEIDDSKFAEFAKKYDEWKAKNKAPLEGLEDSSRVLSKSLRDTQQKMDRFAEATGKATGNIKASSSAMSGFTATAHRGVKAFGKMAHFSGTVLKNTLRFSKAMLKFGLGGGLAGLGGLFGISELAENLVKNQRTARGLGLNQGQVRAFRSDYSNFVPENMLNSVVQAQGNFQGRTWLGYATGMDQSKVRNMGADKLAQRVISAAHDWWKNTPSAFRVQDSPKAKAFEAAGLNWEDIQRLGNTPQSELNRASQRYNRDRRGFNVPEQSTRGWYQLTRQLSVAANSLQTFMGKQLSALGPALGKMVGALTKTIESGLAKVLTPKNINAMASGIEDAAKFLASPEFMNDLKKFQNAIVDLGKMIEKIAHFFGIGESAEQDKKNAKLMKERIDQFKPTSKTVLDLPSRFMNQIPSGPPPSMRKNKPKAPSHVKLHIHSNVSGLTINQINAAGN